MDEYGVCDGDLALVCRNRSKIDLCGPKSVHDHGDDISYFCDLDFYGSFLKPAHGYIEEIFGQTVYPSNGQSSTPT